MKSLTKFLSRVIHIHIWETTHTNRWMHPTAQKCRCGTTREMVHKVGDYRRSGPPWGNVNWVDSSGKVYKYRITD